MPGDKAVNGQFDRTLITAAGDVIFTRTLYQNRKDKTYHFLLDELMGLPSHERFSEQAEAKVLREPRRDRIRKQQTV